MVEPLDVHHIYFHLGKVSILLLPAWVITLAPSSAALSNWITASTFAETPRNLEPNQQLKLQKRGEEKLSQRCCCPVTELAVWIPWESDVRTDFGTSVRRTYCEKCFPKEHKLCVCVWALQNQLLIRLWINHIPLYFSVLFAVLC